MNPQKITVSLPNNISNEDLHLFKGKETYDLNPLKILTLNNVFVSYSGLCLSENGLVKESHHDDPDHYQDFLNNVSTYYYRAKRNEHELITLDDDNMYLLIHHPWYNYYHWICEVILRLWLVKDRIEEMTLLLPERCKRDSWAMESLAPFKFKNIFYIPHQNSVLVRNLCLPEIKQDCHAYYRKELFEIKDFYLSYCKNQQLATMNFGDRIYVSRKKASKRTVYNEDEVEATLIKKGFTVINNEDYNFNEQVSIYSHAEKIVSIHGAGLTNMIWMRKGSSVLEMHKKKTNTKDIHSLVYWYLADTLGHKYFQQVCEPVNREADFFEADLIIDIKKLEDSLINFLK